MPLLIKARKDYVDSLRSSVRAEIPALDPTTERRSFIGGLVKAIGSLMTDWYIALKRYADHEPFPQTATGAFLRKGWWRAVTRLDPNPAAAAHGFIVITGTNGTIIPSGSLLSGSDGVTFETLNDCTIVNQGLRVTALTYDSVAGVCIVETVNRHYFATGLSVTISGATPSAYNGTFPITVTDDNEFTYVPASTPGSTPATGSSIQAAALFASVEVEATSTGQTTNQSSGGAINFSSAPTGVDTSALVTFGGLTGGTDAETDDAYRARVLEALGVDFGAFSADEITIVAKQVPGVTRVFVRRASLSPPPGYPQEGQVKVAFLRDNDANPLPSAQEVADVYNRLLALELQAHTAPEDLIVLSPPPYTVNFTFTSITPDTPGMRLAIAAALKQFFLEEAQWGGTITTLDYECVIKSAVDLSTRQRLKSFVLTSPSADIVAGTTVGYGYDDYPVLGTVTFA